MGTNKLNNTTAGLAGLLQGVYTGIQNNRANNIAQGQLINQSQETAWKDPNRIPTQLDVLKEQANPLNMAIAQMLNSHRMLLGNNPSGNNAGIDIPVGSGGGQPQFLTPAQRQQQQQAKQTQQATAPIPVQKFDWLSASPDDFTGWQAEMKKRQAQRGA